ncbi:MAG TPA: hypothetical protein VM240_10045 [Verrucomicrobiae bacterium]|nr:hypothetical protein [Verrucomicrobiae bacterium]
MGRDSSRFAGKPWWQMPLMASTRTWSDSRPPLKGEFGGQCQRIACEHREAHWFNDTNGRYYCAACASAFNEVCRRNGQRSLCELHPGPNVSPAAASGMNDDRVAFE